MKKIAVTELLKMLQENAFERIDKDDAGDCPIRLLRECLDEAQKLMDAGPSAEQVEEIMRLVQEKIAEAVKKNESSALSEAVGKVVSLKPKGSVQTH